MNIIRMHTVLLLLLVSFVKLSAQLEVFVSEVTVVNDVLYYKNQPLTGVLFSDDDTDIPNKCECTLQAFYRNGLLNGKKTTWNVYGQLTTQEEYLNGVLHGDKRLYDKGKLIKRGHYEHGVLIYEEIYDFKGNLLQNNLFIPEKKIKKIKKIKQAEKKIILETYLYDQLIKTEVFNLDNNLIKSEKTQGDIKTVIEYDENGTINSEYKYRNNELIYGGRYYDNKKNGLWIEYSDDLLKKIIKEYKNGELITQKVIDTRKYIKNNKQNENNKIVLFNNDANHDESFYMLKFINFQFNTSLKEKIIQLILKRTKLITDYQKYGENEINYKLIFKYTDSKHLIIVKSDFEDKIFEKYLVSFDNNQLIEDLRLIETTHDKTKEKSDLYTVIVKMFPVYIYISEIRKETDTEINYVSLNKGSDEGISKHPYFVYDNDQKSLMSELKPIKVYRHKTICKVISFQEWLKKYNQNHNKILIVEKMDNNKITN